MSTPSAPKNSSPNTSISSNSIQADPEQQSTTNDLQHNQQTSSIENTNSLTQEPQSIAPAALDPSAQPSWFPWPFSKRTVNSSTFQTAQETKVEFKTTSKTPCGKMSQPIVIGLSDSVIAIRFTVPNPVIKEIPQDLKIKNLTGALVSSNDDAIEIGKLVKPWICAVCDYQNKERALLKCESCSSERPLPLAAINRFEALITHPEFAQTESSPVDNYQEFEYQINLSEHKVMYGGKVVVEIVQGDQMEMKPNGPYMTYSIKDLKPDMKYDLKIQARLKSDNPKIINDWSAPSDVLTVQTLETDDQQRLENIARVVRFLETPENFESYPEDEVIPDTVSDKVGRSLEGALSIFSWTGIAQTYISIVKNAWKLQKSGLAALIFREDLQQLVAALSAFINEAAGSLELTYKDIIVGTYYLTWEYKRQRLLRPNGEYLDHKMGELGVLEEEAPDAMIRELCWYLPLANMSYRSSPAQIQWVLDTFPSRESTVANTSQGSAAAVAAVSIARVARRKSVMTSTNKMNTVPINGSSAPLLLKNAETVAMASPLDSVGFTPPFRLIAARCNSKKLGPAFFIAANPKTLKAIIAVRGTYDFEDVLTDSLCDVATAKFRFHEGSSTGKEMGPEYRVHAGYLQSAKWMLRGDNRLLQVADNDGNVQNGQGISGAGIMQIVKMLREKKYSLTLTGHSLGAGVAVLCALLIADEFPDISIRVVGYGTPACVDERLAEACKGNVSKKYMANNEILPDLAKRVSVISLIFRDDIVPRLSLVNARKFAVELKETSPRWDPLVRQDLASFMDRVKTVWAPTQRIHSVNIYQQDPSKVSKSPVGTSNTEKIENIERSASPTSAAAAELSTSMANSSSQYASSEATSRTSSGAEYQLVPPGLIAHVYQHRSTHHAALVDYRFEPLRRIEPHFNIIDDHRLHGVLTCMRNVVAVREAEKKGFYGPHWESLADHQQQVLQTQASDNVVMSNRVECAVCRYFVGWDITGTEESSEVRGSHHCYSCGLIVCENCSLNAMSLPSIGVLHSVRVCDDCKHKLTLCNPFSTGQDSIHLLGLDMGEVKPFDGHPIAPSSLTQKDSRAMIE